MKIEANVPEATGSGQASPCARPVPANKAIRRRRRLDPARPHAVFARLSADEYSVISAAAAVAGVTPTSYVGATAVAVARGVVAPLPSSTGDAVRELVAARTQLVRYGTLLNQSVAKLNSTGQADAGLSAAVTRCEAAIAGVRKATESMTRARPT